MLTTVSFLLSCSSDAPLFNHKYNQTDNKASTTQRINTIKLSSLKCADKPQTGWNEAIWVYMFVNVNDTGMPTSSSEALFYKQNVHILRPKHIKLWKTLVAVNFQKFMVDTEKYKTNRYAALLYNSWQPCRLVIPNALRTRNAEVNCCFIGKSGSMSDIYKQTYISTLKYSCRQVSGAWL